MQKELCSAPILHTVDIFPSNRNFNKEINKRYIRKAFPDIKTSLSSCVLITGRNTPVLTGAKDHMRKFRHKLDYYLGAKIWCGAPRVVLLPVITDDMCDK